MILAFDIGGSRIRAARNGVPVGEVPTPLTDYTAFVTALRSFLRGDERGVAISIAGFVDAQTGKAVIANIPCVNGLMLQDDLSDALNLPVMILNDADCFALAETAKGAAKGHRNVFAIILGSGVGGALVLGGKLVEGAPGFAGEWGHGAIIRDPVFPCGCGQSGCLDTVGSARGLERLHHHLTGESIGSVEVIRRWRAGQASPAVPLWLDLVSGPLALILNTTGASIVPVGGGLANDSALIGALDRAVRARILWRTSQPVVVVATTGADSGLIGASVAGEAGFA